MYWEKTWKSMDLGHLAPRSERLRKPQNGRPILLLGKAFLDAASTRRTSAPSTISENPLHHQGRPPGKLALRIPGRPKTIRSDALDLGDHGRATVISTRRATSMP
jgi:hypothetical protein